MTPSSASISSKLEEGSHLFASKDYEGAKAAWSSAASLCGDADRDAKALALCNVAACDVLGKRWDEAERACSDALAVQPRFLKALARRAKARENTGNLNGALEDLKRANALEGATPATRAAEERVRSSIEARRRAASQAAQIRFPAKLAFGEDVRALELHPSVTYYELLQLARRFFPKAAPLTLKVKDAEGELVTVDGAEAVRAAMRDSLRAAVSGEGDNAQIDPSKIKVIRIEVVTVASPEDVPAPPREEVEFVEAALARLAAEEEAARREAGEAGAAGASSHLSSPPAPLVDEWILRFVELLREHSGIDPDRPLEAAEVGNERLQAAYASMMSQDRAKALELLDEAEERFAEQVCQGMYNRGQVEQYRADFLTGDAAAKGASADEVRPEVNEHLDNADKHYREALAYKPDYLDGFLGRSSVEQARAKLAANYLVEPINPGTAEAEGAEGGEAKPAPSEETLTRAAAAKAAARVTASTLRASESHMDRAIKYVEQAIAAMPAAEADKELPKLKPSAEQIPGDPADEISTRASLLINLGNAFYERSVLRAAGGGEWRELVEKAADLFREAGAHPQDVRAALQGHPKADQLDDLIKRENDEEEARKKAAQEKEEKTEQPKEETEQPKEETPAPAPTNKAAESKPKGVPALPKKKGKGRK